MEKYIVSYEVAEDYNNAGMYIHDLEIYAASPEKLLSTVRAMYPNRKLSFDTLHTVTEVQDITASKKSSDKWFKLSERLPPINQWVICSTKAHDIGKEGNTGKNYTISNIFFYRGGSFWGCMDGQKYPLKDVVTYWMRLPNAPND